MVSLWTRFSALMKIRGPWISSSFSFILAWNYNGFVVDMFLLCSRRVIKIRVWWIHASFKCEESAPFSHKCHNCDVPERVAFWRIGSVLVRVSQLCNLSLNRYFKMSMKPKEIVWIWCAPSMFHWCNLNMKPCQIGILWSGTRNCPQRCEINHFCPGSVSAVQLSEILS